MILSIKRNIKEQHNNFEGVEIIYSKDAVGVNLGFRDDPDRKEFVISATLRHLATKQDIKQIGEIRATAEGSQGDMKNKAEVEAYKAKIKALNDSLSGKLAEIRQIELDLDKAEFAPRLNDGTENPKRKPLLEQREKLKEEYNDTEKDLTKVKAVTPEFEKDMFYDEVKGWFDLNNNTLTAEGKKKIKKLNFGAVKLGDEVDISSSKKATKK